MSATDQRFAVTPPALLIALALFVTGVEAQPASSLDEGGLFYVQNFGPETYGGGAQNLAVVQGAEGLIYVGNGAGVFEYDGVSWRLIPVPNGNGARSLAVDAEGRVFVGTSGDIGYLAPDALGRMRYVSLLEQIPEEDRDISSVWTTYTLPDGIYFQTAEHIFRWNGRKMKVWRPQVRFYLGYVVHDTYYVMERDGQMFNIAEDTLHPAPGGTTFVGQRIQSLVPHGADAYLVVTAEHGLFRCREGACVRFSPDLTDLLSKLRPYHATELPDGSLAIGTVRGGVVLLDQAGRLRRIVNEASGLRNERVWSTYVDRQGGLWLALDNGLARVEVTAPLTYFDKSTGLAGTVVSVARHRERLYAATTLGLYVLEPKAEGIAPHFVAVPGVERPCWSLLSTPQGLLAGCFGEGYNVDERRWGWSSLNTIMTLYRSRQNPAQLYLGLQVGLARVNLRAGAWNDAVRIDGVREQVRGIVEDAQGLLWMGTPTDGLLRLEPAAAPSDAPDITRFGVEDGLPAGTVIPISIGGRITFFTEAGLFGLDSQAQSGRSGSVGFVPDITFDAFLPASSVETLTEDDQGRVWIIAGEASGVAHPQADGSYTFVPTALRRVPNLQAEVVHAEAGGPVWAGGPDGLIRLDTAPSPGGDRGGKTQPLDLTTDYSVRVRRVTTAAGSILYDGHEGGPATTLAYQDNALRFAFAAPRYDALERTHYRTRLEGFDRSVTGDDWSAWSTETDKDYTNLWEGHYVFRVQARDIYGVKSREDSFAFRILPPWYRTWWAYGLYGLALAAVVLAFVRFQRKKLRREQRISARLREVDKLKDEFLANTSHELRTPLFGLIGLADSLIDGAAGELPEAAKAHLEMIAGSGRRLSRLVNDILDHSRLTHGSLRLKRGPVDLHALTETVVALQSPLAANKGLGLRNAVPTDLPAVDADAARVEQILHNLVGNAVKFTAEGHVEVRARLRDEQIEMVVEDTGIGIAKGERERIFLAFEQVDSGVQRAFGGTGLGLAVARRLVELHGGDIEVESAVGEGTRVVFSLPVSREPARPAQASERPVSRPLHIEPVARTVSPRLLPPKGSVAATAPTSPTDGSGIPGARILVVDDESVNRLVLSMYLAAESYEVELAENGADALRLLAEQAFDLVVLDVMMPEMSGYEVCRTLREQCPLEELPVIFLTAKNQVSDLVEGLDAGGNDYLAKPVDQEELAARVRTHLELLSVHRRLAATNAEMARFNDIAAHELRNPLVTIKNFLGLARRDADSGHANRLATDLDHLDTAAENLQRLLDELFELSRLK